MHLNIVYVIDYYGDYTTCICYQHNNHTPHAVHSLSLITYLFGHPRRPSLSFHPKPVPIVCMSVCLSCDHCCYRCLQCLDVHNHTLTDTHSHSFLSVQCRRSLVPTIGRHCWSPYLSSLSLSHVC